MDQAFFRFTNKRWSSTHLGYLKHKQLQLEVARYLHFGSTLVFSREPAAVIWGNTPCCSWVDNTNPQACPTHRYLQLTDNNLKHHTVLHSADIRHFTCCTSTWVPTLTGMPAPYASTTHRHPQPTATPRMHPNPHARSAARAVAAGDRLVGPRGRSAAPDPAWTHLEGGCMQSSSCNL